MAGEALEITDAIRLAVAFKHGDEPKIRELLGDRYAPNLKQIAKGFGVKETTVRNTWRRGNDGLPGTASNGGNGRFPWGDALMWFLQRSTSAAEGRGSDEATKAKKLAEARIAEADARIKERKAEVVEGEYILQSIPVAVVSTRANLLRDRLLEIDQVIKPMLPAKYAGQCIEEIKRFIRNVLTAFSESSINDLEDAANEGKFEDV